MINLIWSIGIKESIHSALSLILLTSPVPSLLSINLEMSVQVSVDIGDVGQKRQVEKLRDDAIW